ncbi:MAG: hypothetical protein MUC62_07525 [Candidatus Thermoplasmatota archaeon]|nr:hypothetical protein [Candidatus Thermoplasmatota archaeon]
MVPSISGMVPLVLLLLFGGLCLAAFLPDGAEAVGEMSVTAFFDRNSVDAHVDPERGGFVTFTGYVVPLFPFEVDGQYAIIRLTAEAGGWETTDIPVLTATKVTNELMFSVSVLVPPETRASGGDITQTLTVSGTWSYEPESRSGQVEPVEGFIVIRQYYMYRLSLDRSYVQVSPGTEFDIEIRIENQGNGDDEVEIDIEGREVLEEEGWTFQMNRTLFRLPYNGKVRMGMTITTPKDWSPWVNEVRIFRFIVVSSQAVGTPELELYEVAGVSMFVRTQGISVPGFEPVIALIALAAGAALFAGRRLRG